MKETEVFITGIGLITSLGIGWEANWRGMCEGNSGIRMIRSFDTAGFHTRFGGEIPEDFDAFFSDHFPRRIKRHTAPFSQLGLAATHLALEDSGLALDQEDRSSIGICLGTGSGGLSYWEDSFGDSQRGYLDAVRSLESLAVLKYMSNAPSAVTSLYFGIEGPSMTISTSCASGAHAIATACDMIKLGRAEVMIAGGLDVMVCQVSLSSFNKLQALSERNDDPQRASRPFDKQRDGFVLGDGAGVLVLESSAHRQKRKAKPYAKIRGYAVTSEASHMVHPCEDGRKMAETMRRALKDATVSPHEMDYLNAHGTSTLLNDKFETMAIKEVFGPHANRLAISSQKSMIGHTVGAAGAIELAVTALSVAKNIIVPTINYEFPDKDCDLDYTPNVARELEIKLALSNSFGFGGHNCSIIVAKP